MPPYPWLETNVLDVSNTPAKITALRRIGVPYPDGFEETAVKNLEAQAKEIALDLQKSGAAIDADKELVALIAYLQRLGKDIKAVPTAPAK